MGQFFFGILFFRSKFYSCPNYNHCFINWGSFTTIIDFSAQKMVSRQFIGAKVVSSTTSVDVSKKFSLFLAAALRALKAGRQLPDNYSFLADGARATTLGSTAHRRDTGGLPKLWTKTRVEYFWSQPCVKVFLYCIDFGNSWETGTLWIPKFSHLARKSLLGTSGVSAVMHRGFILDPSQRGYKSVTQHY